MMQHKLSNKLIIVIACCFVGLPLLARADTTSNLVGWWTFDESTGTTASDSSAHSLTGSLNNFTVSDSKWTTGQIHGALQFDGINDYVTATGFYGYPVPNDFTDTGLTYDSQDDALWVGDFTNERLQKISKTGAFISQIQLMATTTPGTGIQGVAYDSSDNTLWYVDIGTSTIQHLSKAGAKLSDPITINMTTGSGANGLAYEADNDSLWVTPANGNLIKRYSASTGTLQQSLTISALASTSGMFDGVVYDATDGSLWITSDPNLIYHISSTTGAILGTFSEVGNIEHIAIDTTDNTLYVANDELFHTGTYKGNKIYHYNKSLQQLSPTDATISVDSFTSSLWIFPTNVATGTQVLMENISTSTNLFALALRSTGALSSNISTALDSATGLITNNNWYLVTATFNGSTLTLYINGSQVAQASKTRAVFQGGYTNIGYRPNSSSFGFIGKVDDARVYSRALSGQDVLDLYHQGIATPPVVTSQAASSIGPTSVTLNGTITADNFASSTVRGFSYGLTSAYGATTTSSGTFALGAFTTNLTGLTCNTVYHFAPYASNLAGTSTNPADDTFTTAGCATNNVDNTSSSTVQSTISVTSSSGSASSRVANLRAMGLYAEANRVAAQYGLAPTTNPPIVQPITGAVSYNFGVGYAGEDVRMLQRLLNTHGYILATSGPGSPGNETAFFGALTRSAVMKYQKDHGLPVTGYFGPLTHASLVK